MRATEQTNNIPYSFIFGALALVLAMWSFLFPGRSLGGYANLLSEGVRHSVEVQTSVTLILSVLVFFSFIIFARRRISPLRPTTILFGVLVLSLPLFFLPPIGSTDVFANGYYGHLVAVDHLNPYTVQQSAPIQNVFYTFTRAAHPFQTTYGPLWISITAVFGSFFHNHVVVTVTAYRILSLVTLLVVFFSLSRMMAGHPRRSLALALVGWNPFILFEVVNNAHNDIVMVACILAGLAIMRSKYSWLALPIITAGFLIKYIPFLLVPIITLALWQIGKRRFSSLLLGSVLSIALIIVSFLPYWEGIRIFRGLILLGTFAAEPFFSPLNIIHKTLRFFGMGDTQAFTLARNFGFLMFFVGSVLLLLRQIRQKMKATETNAFLLLLLFMGTVLIYFQPWYFLWVLPLVPFVREKSWVPLTLLCTALAVSLYPT